MTRDDHDHGHAPVAWQPRPWWAWSCGALVVGVAVLAWAAVRLAASDLGTSLRPRGCDADVIGAVLLLVVGSLVLLTGMAFARLHQPGSHLSWETTTVPWALPVPVLLLGATLPGIAGCTAARDLAQLPVIGDALVGASGVVLAGASAVLVAAALATAASVSWIAPAAPVDEPDPSIVDLAIAEAESLETDPAAQRFHGVE